MLISLCSPDRNFICIAFLLLSYGNTCSELRNSWPNKVISSHVPSVPSPVGAGTWLAPESSFLCSSHRSISSMWDVILTLLPLLAVWDMICKSQTIHLCDPAFLIVPSTWPRLLILAASGSWLTVSPAVRLIHSDNVSVPVVILHLRLYPSHRVYSSAGWSSILPNSFP